MYQPIARLAAAMAAALAAGCGGAPAADSPADSPAAQPPAASTGSAASACATGPLAGDGIGTLRLGMTTEALHASCTVLRDSTILGPEGMPARVATVVTNGDTLLAEIDSGRVWRIGVVTPGLRTADSLGVGTPARRLADLPGARGITGEGQLFVVADQPCGLSFQVKQPGPAAITSSTPQQLRALPDSITVTRVLVVGCGPR